MNPRIPALRRIGIDLDNTIVDYTALILEEVTALGVLDVVPAGDKRIVRDALRSVPEGEWHWMQLQARIYGPRLDGAVPFPGVIRFLERCRRARIDVCIVSHKTEFAAVDAGDYGPSLRESARGWLRANQVVGPNGVPIESVFFESTRADKAARIATLDLDVFIDDLVEVFVHPAFPARVRRWLFAPEPMEGELPVDRRFSAWDQIEREVFGG